MSCRHQGRFLAPVGCLYGYGHFGRPLSAAMSAEIGSVMTRARTRVLAEPTGIITISQIHRPRTDSRVRVLSAQPRSRSPRALQAWRSDERLISRNHRARWRHRKVQRCTVGYRRGLAGRRGSGTTPHGSGPLSVPDDSAAGSEYQYTSGARLLDSCLASMA